MGKGLSTAVTRTFIYFFTSLCGNRDQNRRGICSRASKQSDILMVAPVLRILCNLRRDEDEMGSRRTSSIPCFGVDR